MKTIAKAKCLSSIQMLTPFILILLFVNQGLAQSTKAKPWVVPPAALQVKNPLAGDPASAAKEGKKTYTTYCTPCHGNGGKGDGVASASVNPKPADHTSDAVQSEPDGSLYYKMTEGRGPMISYKQVLNETQRWQLVCYIRTLAKKKS